MECPVDGCQEYLPSKRALGEHIRVDHHGKYSLVCKLCPIRRTYASMSNMQKHWRDHHADSVPQARAAVNPRAVDSMDVDADDASMNDYGTCNDESDDVPTNADSANDDPGIRQFFSRQMGRGTARTSLDDVNALLERVLRIVESGDSQAIARARLDLQATSSHYKRTQLLLKSGECLAVRRHQMGIIQSVKRDSNGKALRVEQGEFFHSFDLSEILRQAVSFCNTHNLLRPCTSDKICCHQQGELFKSLLSLPNQSMKPLPFLLYCDDVSPGGNLGPKSSANSLCIFQIKLAGLHLDVSSSLASKFVYTVAYAKDHAAHAFRPIIDLLEQDVAAIRSRGGLEINHEVYNPILLSVIADNKAQYEVRGLLLNYRRCRLCLTESQSFLTARRPQNVVLKDRKWFEDASARGALKNHGFKDSIPLAAISEYDFMNDHTLDLMHDIMEGEAPRSIIRLLCALDRRGLKLNTINPLLANWPYGKQDAACRPSPFKHDSLSGTSIGQRASQTNTLLRLLPLILHKQTDISDCPEWDSFVLLGKIVLILLQPSFCDSDLCTLENLVAQYIASVEQILTENPELIGMTIKSHHLIHYSRFIRMLGPPTLNWCMDFEMLNAAVKAHSYQSRNYQNLPFTMISHAQHFLNSQRVKFSLEAYPTYGAAYPSDLPSDSPLRAIFSELVIDPDMISYRLEYLGMSYGERDMVVMSGGPLPAFGQIQMLALINDTWQMIVEHCTTVEWLDSINCYSVQLCDTLTVLSFDSLNSAHPLDSYFDGNIVCVPLRHFPLE